MAIDSRKLINSAFSIKLASFLCRTLPPKQGLRLAYFIADRFAAQKQWKLVQATRANQRVVLGESVDEETLDIAVRDVFRYIAYSTYDLYHNLNNIEAIQKRVEFSSGIQYLINRSTYAERGLMLVALHMSNFDFVAQAVFPEGLKALVLTLPELAGGYMEQFLLRQKSGMHILPASVSTLRQAIEHLRAGGLVITGLDRPDEASDYHPRFFGKPASLPIHHIYLAIKSKVPIVVAAIFLQQDKKYHIKFSEPIEMLPYADRRSEILYNTERVLQVAESFIRLAPQQWTMTLPVWPDIKDQAA